MRPGKVSSFFAPIRMRYLFVVLIILGAVFFSLTYWGIKQARQSLLKIMVDEGRALARSLTLSSNNAIQSGLLVQSLSEEKLSEIAETAKGKLKGKTNPAAYRQFCADYDIQSIDILDSSLGVLASNRWAIGFQPDYPNEVQADILETMRQGGGFRTVLSYGDDSTASVTQYFIYEFAPDETMITGGRLLILAVEATYLDQIIKQIGIGYLLQEISGQSGIDYIFLQTRDGIIFASRALPPVLKLDEDPFLVSRMATDTTGWRINEFEGKNVLEIAVRFESVSYPPGVYRLGLELDDFNELSRGYDRQIIIVAIVLFLLTFLVVAIVSINQNYFILDKSFKQMRSISGTIFGQLTSGVLVYNAGGDILAINKALTRLTGIDASFIGRPVDDIRDRLPFALPDPEAAGNRPVEIETGIVAADGKERTILLGSSRLPEESGGGIVVLMHDITERKLLEEDNRRKERLSEMGDMAAGVAHEIRNPLNAIGIAAQRLQMEFKPNDDAEEYGSLTKNILSETARLNEILTRFLDLAKARAAEKKPVTLAHAIDKALTSLSGEAARKNIEITFNRDDSIRVRGDINKYQQVFINLIKNALQAMTGAGKISIDMDRRDHGTVVTVSDTGPGFPADSMAKIFQPYFTTKSDGSGLGLALAYKTITEYEGTIKAANIEPTGARIEITLPIV